MVGIPLSELLSKPHKLTVVTACRDTLILTKFRIIYFNHLLFYLYCVTIISYLAIFQARSSVSKRKELCYPSAMN